MHRVPAALRGQDVHRRVLRGGLEQRAVVARDPVADPRADRGAIGQQRRQPGLHGRRDGQVGVADDLEPLERRPHELVGAGGNHPSQLQLRQPEALRQASEAEGQRLALSQYGGRPRQVAIEHVLGEDLVADECQAVRTTVDRKGIQFRAPQIRPGRVVRVHHDDRARTVGRRTPQAVDVERPLPVVLEVVGARPDGVQRGQVLEERVARRRHEHLVAGIAEQLEEHRVRVARAGGQHDAVARHGHAAAAEVAHHRVARGRQSEGLRRVGEA